MRLQKKLTQTELAILLIQSGHHINSNFISRFESGHSRPWPAARKAIASVLEMSEFELFPEYQQQTPLD
ncbi:helix-turn-helix domain-containing protein [uncultured Nostoc sp.]|uniref:helix-turn-helix domain-containing protein n=1 Tax=uncultured Nostoc sp. TaxID=340711 RepID=UPI0035CA438D